MNAFTKDIFIGIVFLLGLFGFMSGEFIISTALFAVAAVTSNIKFYQTDDKQKVALCD